MMYRLVVQDVLLCFAFFVPEKRRSASRTLRPENF